MLINTSVTNDANRVMNNRFLLKNEWYNFLMKINIIVVDDDPVITEELKRIILTWPEYYRNTISIRTENSLRNVDI